MLSSSDTGVAPSASTTSCTKRTQNFPLQLVVENPTTGVWHSAGQPWLQMRMGRQITVDMFHDAMVLFAGGVQWVHMDHGVGEMQYVVQ